MLPPPWLQQERPKIWEMRCRSQQDPSIPARPRKSSTRWYASPTCKLQNCLHHHWGLLLPCFLLQSFNLLQMAGAVGCHSFDQLGQGKILLRLRVKGRFAEV